MGADANWSQPEEADGAEGEAVIFAEYSDDEYRRERANTVELWQEEVGQWYDGEKIYRDDLLPVPRYLDRCLAAFHALGLKCSACGSYNTRRI